MHRAFDRRAPARTGSDLPPADDAQVKLAICILVIAAVLYVVSIAT
ncbi:MULTISPECIES: hypothetical protein [Methylobacterium]|nr:MULTISPECIES: hypothetical protein [Methylobacterium]NGM37338.1 hypothetical protein [Methylobacterium sp. DB0501]UHC20305.1 hypothetical protein LRS73_35200 [Methylobacterium currus]